jgi:type IV secretory pathway TraG/TraD family ATPase VirD4
MNTTAIRNSLKAASKLFLQFLEQMLYLLELFTDWLISILSNSDDSFGRFGETYRVLKRKNSGFTLTGKSISKELSTQGVLINGTTGSGKSTISVIPSILNVDGSQVNHDPSGELKHKTAGFLQSQGVRVMTVDFKNWQSSEGYNPLHRTHSLKDLNLLAHQLMSHTTKSDKKDFWSTSGSAALVVALRFTKQLPKGYCNLFNTCAILDALSDNGQRKTLSQLAIYLDEFDTGLYDQYQSLVSNASETMQGILANARSAVQMFQLDESLARVTSTDCIGSFSELRDQQTALFLHSSTTNGDYYAGISSIFFQQFFDHLFEYLPSEDSQTLFFHLDEAPLLKSLDHLDLVCANIRKYNGGIMLVTQDAENQLASSFGKEKAQSILTNLRTKVYLSASLSQATKLESELGFKEVEDSKTGRKTKEPLLNRNQIMRLSKALITITGQHPLLVPVRPYYKNPRQRSRTKIDFKGTSGTLLPDPKRVDLERFLDTVKKRFENTAQG